ncbi:MAG: hypothetical protein CME68_03515 [Halobacteriovoraceae bacterium]|nr:hypothetical protein [Halobacteriovoraceae bacterium]|tara:strand:- start:658 stop:1347 length:690 start_codon:yes stop_codon:yes gene_type:complete
MTEMKLKPRRLKMKKKSLIFQKAALLMVLFSHAPFSTHASLGQNSNTQDSKIRPQIEIGKIGYGGSGCPAGSTSEIKNPKFDQKIIFKPLEYHLKIGSDRKRIVRKSCQLSIPVKVPQDISISFDHINFKGNLNLEKGTSLRFSAEYFFAGKRGPKIKATFDETKLKSFLIGPEEKTPHLWSECGESVNLRINTALLLRTKRLKKASAALEFIQIGKDLRGAIKWKRCH